MIIKQLLDEDFVNYKKPSMFIGFPTCTWKCEKECGKKMCQNSDLANAPDINISYKEIVNRYLNNGITKAIVFGGLEPMDSIDDLFGLIEEFRKYTDDDIVVYTGYNLDEIATKTYYLGNLYKNIYFKVGRYIPGKNNKYDDILGVMLASPNQMGVQIS